MALGLVLLAVFAFFVRWVRTRVYEQHIFARYWWLKKATSWIEDHVEYFFIGFLALGTFGVMALVVWFLGTQRALEAIVFAMGALAFLSFQLPRLLPPNIFVTPLISLDGKTFTEANAVPKLELSCEEKYLLGFQVTNLGINPYLKLGCWISFDDHFTPEMSEDAYRDVDFAKRAKLQRGNKCVYFGPEESYYAIAPANHCVFTVIMKTCACDSKVEGKIKVEVTTETRWKSTIKHIEYICYSRQRSESQGKGA
ncbi:MAG: hypothetical protein HYU86_10700 [Chloroflexi bacterium]|nr:hypothetical protein [Chloroflexota bacterium]